MIVRPKAGAARFVIASREKVEREIILDEGKITIGRAPQNEIIIADPAVSGRHAVIAVTHLDALLEDLDSTNGTQVNGQPIKKHFLQNGDVIELGRYTILYCSLCK